MELCRTCKTNPAHTLQGFCGRDCALRDPGRLSAEGRQRIRESKLGRSSNLSEAGRAAISAAHKGRVSPMKDPAVAARSAATKRAKGTFRGASNPRFTGEWISKQHGRAFVWIDDEMRERLGLKRNSALRSRVNYLRAHPGETLSRVDHIHHINGDKLDDRPENLKRMLIWEHETLHGRTMSQATKDKIRAKSLGRKQTPEAIEKMRAAKRGKSRPAQLVLVTKDCATCSQPFTGITKQLYCGRPCETKAYRQRRKERGTV